MNTLPAIPTVDGDPDIRLALIQLAREFARNLKPKEAILADRGLTEEQYETIVNNPFYQQVLDSETAAFQGAGNTAKRIELEAAITLEQYLPTLHDRIQNFQTPLKDSIEGAKLLAKLAGVGERDPTQQGSGEKI